MPSEQVLSVLFPLLFLVVLKLCDVARSVDLEFVAMNQGWKIPGKEDHIGLPLGVFSFIHAVNYIVLLATFVGVTSTFDGNIIRAILTLRTGDPAFYLAIITLLIWWLLPVLEVSEYQNLINGIEYIPTSITVHFVFTSLTAFISLISLAIRQTPPKIEYSIGIRPITELLMEYLQQALSEPLRTFFAFIVVILFGLTLFYGIVLYLEILRVEIQGGSEPPSNRGYQ